MKTEHSKKLEDILKNNESLETKNISKKRKEDINEFINFKDNRENYYFLWNTTYDLLKEDNFIPESDLASIKLELDSEFNAYANGYCWHKSLDKDYVEDIKKEGTNTILRKFISYGYENGVKVTRKNMVSALWKIGAFILLILLVIEIYESNQKTEVIRKAGASSNIAEVHNIINRYMLDREFSSR